MVQASRRTVARLVAMGAGAVVLAGLAPLGAAGASAQTMAVKPAAGTGAAVATLVQLPARKADKKRGRGRDGYGGEHSGGANCSGDRSWYRHHSPGKGKGSKNGNKNDSGNNNNGNNGTNVNHGNNGNNNNGNNNNGRGDNHGRGDHNGRGDNHGRGGSNGHRNHCHYPPSRSPQVTLSGPNRTRKGRTVTLTGKVTTNGCGMDSVKLGLYSSHDGKTNWVMIRDGEIDKKGNFSFQVPSHATHYYQAVVAAGNGYAVSSSEILPLILRRSGR